MPVNLKCPSCGQPQRLSEEQLGQKVNCPSCGVGFRVSPRKSSPPANPAPAATPSQAGATVPDASPRPPEPQVRPAVAQGSCRSPDVATPGPAVSPRRGGLPTWLYATLGGVAVMALIAIALVLQSFGGSRSSPFPDPAADIALGVASGSQPSPTQPVGGSDGTRGQQRPTFNRLRSCRGPSSDHDAFNARGA